MSVPGFFTAVAPHRLPHPQIPLRLILTTHMALSKAFELLRASPPDEFALATAKEDEITRQLHWILENRLLHSKEVHGFDTRRIKNVIRAPEVTNVDGNHPAKRPDLVLFLLKRESLSTLSSHDGIFAECKPVDDDHPVGSYYCKGLGRFINGDYAWAMQEGMVIAYARGGRTISNSLAPVLASPKYNTELGSPDPPVIVSGSWVSWNTESLTTTVHKRAFSWPLPYGVACDVRIFHSWHNCS